MKMTARKAVDPIIATLLLIAIAVAAGIIVYVYVNSLAGGLTQSGGAQVSEQVSMDSYNFLSLSSPTLSLRDSGGSAVTLPTGSVYYDGNACQTGNAVCTTVAFVVPATNPCTGASLPVTCATGQYTSMTLTLVSGATAGTTHTVKIVSADGGTFVFSVVAGRSG